MRAAQRHAADRAVRRGRARRGGGPFTILRFAEPGLSDVVYLEQLTSALYLDKPTDVDTYMRAMNNLCITAERPDDTVRYLTDVLNDL